MAGTAGLLAIPGAVTGAAGAIGGMPGLATWGGIPINRKENRLLLQTNSFFHFCLCLNMITDGQSFGDGIYSVKTAKIKYFLLNPLI